MLFLIAINDIREGIKFLVYSILFADNLNILCRGKNTNSIRLAIQNTITSLMEWSARTGFIFSASKSR